MSEHPQRASLPTALVIAALGGLLAILLPGLVSGGAEGVSWWRLPIEQPSVWTFQGLFLVGFVLAALLQLQWIDLPLLALAMVGIFPLATLIGAATGGAEAGLQRELYLQGSWLIPSLLGLAVGRTLRALQQRPRDDSRKR